MKVSEKEIKKKSIYSPANLCTTCTYTYVCQYSADERKILEYDETKEQKNWNIYRNLVRKNLGQEREENFTKGIENCGTILEQKHNDQAWWMKQRIDIAQSKII